MKTKIEIKSWFTGSILFEYEKEDNTIKDTLIEAVKSDADLRGANLCGADLRTANLRTADLEPIKKDLFDVLLRAIPEISNLKNAILTGKIDGSTYEGECACLCGTLEKSKSEKIQSTIFDLRDSSRPIERFFVGIKAGDTPENNHFSKIAMDWLEEFEGYIKFSIASEGV